MIRQSVLTAMISWDSSTYNHARSNSLVFYPTTEPSFSSKQAISLQFDSVAPGSGIPGRLACYSSPVFPKQMAFQDIVIIFDFDRTLIDDDSDRWVVTQMELTEVFNQLRPSLPWNTLMDRMMKELYLRGKTVDDIANCLRKTPLDSHIIAAIKAAHSLGCDMKIVSDANQFFIETILEQHGLLGCFSEIFTNPTLVDEGVLRILPYHASTSSPHACNLCPSNLCKGLVLESIHASAPKSKKQRVIYLGDGRGDFCPTLKLGGGDFVMPRKNYPLWDLICSNPKVKAEVHEWSTAKGLEKILLHLINTTPIKAKNF